MNISNEHLYKIRELLRRLSMLSDDHITNIVIARDVENRYDADYYINKDELEAIESILGEM